MITTLRESKARLSELVSLASDGEEILITVHGEPKARLVPVAQADPDVAGWVRELATLRALGNSTPAPSPLSALDEVREDRW
jgi:prevent-host-death family protein